MQAFVSRSYLAPVKDEEAESQRKAKSRHARQTRRSTQGVTLTDLKEAQMSYSLSHQDREKEEESTQGNRLCLRRGFADDTGDQISLTESKETSEFTLKWTQIDKEGNIENRLETVPESPNLSNLSASGYHGFPQSNSFFRVGETTWRDENQNPVEDAAQLTFSTELQQRYLCCDAKATEVCENPSSDFTFTPSCNQEKDELSVILPLDGAKAVRIHDRPPITGANLYMTL
ncbi:protein phosphatase 1 regulatory subunit 12B-like [Gambusia affinis]|uniref:protein phosphatase 1 regulatory subunit 12B-like n=1 Tax=Gambusia affinis TaxID=33528 RepID=UPI001CDD04D2|nr:protein phosphatase 1 regulatory subunit 12B-like [Gambusia affinis]